MIVSVQEVTSALSRCVFLGQAGRVPWGELEIEARMLDEPFSGGGADVDFTFNAA